MLKFGNKEFLNLEEQVGKNKRDIERLQSGIKIDRWLASVTDLPTYLTEANVGKYYLVYTNNGDHLYLITKRENGGLLAEDLGRYPAAEQGPQGLKGDKGDKGDTGERGPQGIQGVQGVRGSPGYGWSALTDLDATATPTESIQGDKVKYTTTAQLKTDDNQVHPITMEYLVPAAPDTTLYVPKTTTIAGIDLSGNISAQSLTDALIYMNTTTDVDYVMED